MSTINDFRPMPKSLIKKRFLKALYEQQVGSMKNIDYRAILRAKMHKLFSIPPITTAEYNTALIAVQELSEDGFIESSNNPNIYTLTEKGFIEARKNDIKDMQIPPVNILDILCDNFKLAKQVWPQYKNGEYETAIFNSFKLLEEKIRLKSNLSNKEIGVDLVNKAFNTKNGKLICSLIPDDDDGQKEALHTLMRGAIMFFKNPSSHRTVNYNDINEIIEIILFSKYLNDILDSCKLR